MAAYSTLPIAGINLTQTFPATAVEVTTGPLGLETFASDGRLYVFGEAYTAAITAGSTVTLNSAFVISPNSAGSYTVGSANLVAGDYAWVSKASV
jgi:hypothetical protein